MIEAFRNNGCTRKSNIPNHLGSIHSFYWLPIEKVPFVLDEVGKHRGSVCQKADRNSLLFVFVDLLLQAALNVFNIEKDVKVKLDEMEIYFLTNQSGREIMVNPSFRVEGRSDETRMHSDVS